MMHLGCLERQSFLQYGLVMHRSNLFDDLELSWLVTIALLQVEQGVVCCNHKFVNKIN